MQKRNYLWSLKCNLPFFLLILFLILFSPKNSFSEISRAELATPPPDSTTYVHYSIIPATAMQLAEAMDIPTGDIISATLSTSDSSGVGISDSPLGSYFPTNGNTFTILSTGRASVADAPNSSGSTSTQLGGLNNIQGNDMVQLKLRLRVPTGASCLNFHFAFYSEEFPEWVGSQYNDAFTAEIGGTNIQIINNQVVAPLNFAFDTAGKVISVNTVFGYTLNTGTTYDGATPLLIASSPVEEEGTPPEVELVLTIQDLGDSIYDSAVFLDSFWWGFGQSCEPGVSLDKDGDALLDEWETKGIDVDNNGTIDLNLPAMGADPNHKDIFVEIDYMVKPVICNNDVCSVGHSHKPKKEAIDEIICAFAKAPVENPDGIDGIRLHVDYGKNTIMNPIITDLENCIITGSTWGDFSESDPVQNPSTQDEYEILGVYSTDPITQEEKYNWGDFDKIKKDHFSITRGDVFHYAIFAHNLPGGYSGISRGFGASDFIVSLGSTDNQVGTVSQQAGTFMHELGHNLGLRHGGRDDINYKPNYISVMNYSFQMRGLRINNQDMNYDYSRFKLPDVDENSLIETLGLNAGTLPNSYGTRYYCGPTDKEGRLIDNANAFIDWNCDGVHEPLDVNGNFVPISANINKDLLPVFYYYGSGSLPQCPDNVAPDLTVIDIDNNISIVECHTTLRSHDDWKNIVFNGGAVGKLGQQINQPIETEVDEITINEDAQLITPFSVVVSAPFNLALFPGTTAIYNFLVKNAGGNVDTYNLTGTSSKGWCDIKNIPTSVILNPGEETIIQINVTVPLNASEDETDEFNLQVVSETNPLIVDSTSVMTYVNIPKNKHPIASAGPDQILECTSPAGASTTLDGLASYDPDGDPLTYNWTGCFGAASGVNHAVDVPIGVCPVDLVVNDGQVNSDPDSVTITVQDTTPPSLECPANILEECTSPAGQAINLGIPTVSDACSNNIAVSNNAPPLFTLGTTPVTWTAIDEYGNPSQGIQTVNIVDTTPPDISVTCSPNVLWPPNHNMIEIFPTVNTSDICDASVNAGLYQITMNEGEETNTYDPNYDTTTGDGHTINDIQVTPDGHIYLRSERSGNNPSGRKYTIIYKSTDDSGNSSTASCEVIVPHDMK